eukprot:Opistho-2@34109
MDRRVLGATASGTSLASGSSGGLGAPTEALPAGPLTGPQYQLPPTLSTRFRVFTGWINFRLWRRNLTVGNVLRDTCGKGILGALLDEVLGDKQLLRPERSDSFSQRIRRVENCALVLEQHGLVRSGHIDAQRVVEGSEVDVLELLWIFIAEDIRQCWRFFGLDAHHEQKKEEAENAKALVSQSQQSAHGPGDSTTAVPSSTIGSDSNGQLNQHIFTGQLLPPVTDKRGPQMMRVLAADGVSGSIAPSALTTAAPSPVLGMRPGSPASGVGVTSPTKRRSKGRGYLSQYDKKTLRRVIQMCQSFFSQSVSAATETEWQLNCARDLMDSKVYCALVNALAPGTFVVRMMLNDRTTFEMATWAMDGLLLVPRCLLPTDMVRATFDPIATLAYLAMFFRGAVAFRGGEELLRTMKTVQTSINDGRRELRLLKPLGDPMAELDRQKSLEREVALREKRFRELVMKAKADRVDDMMSRLTSMVKDAHQAVRVAMQRRYNIMDVTANSTVAGFAALHMVNLAITRGQCGFFLVTKNEFVSSERTIVLRKRAEPEVLVDEHDRPSSRELLGMADEAVAQIVPERFPAWEIFISCQSLNTLLHKGEKFMYQMFPSSLEQSTKELHKAAKGGKMGVLRELVNFFHADRPGFVDGIDTTTGSTTLHAASKRNHVEMANFLLEHGGSLDAKNRRSRTPLHVAREAGHLKVSRVLIEHGANTSIRDRDGNLAFDMMRNPMHRQQIMDIEQRYRALLAAMHDGNVACILTRAQQHKAGTDLFNIRLVTESGDTLVHVAARAGHHELASILLSRGCKVNARNKLGRTPLHDAATMAVVEVLIDYNANLSIQDSEGNTALHYAAAAENGMAMVRLLLQRGSKTKTKNTSGETPIAVACRFGRTECLLTLLEMDPEAAERPPLVVAAEYGHGDTVRALLDRGVKVERPVLTQTLGAALVKGKENPNCIDVVKLLIEKGASVQVPYAGGNTALHLATLGNRPDVCAFLFERNVLVNARNDLHETPLHIAMRNDNMRMAELLVANGSDGTVKTKTGLTPYDYIGNLTLWQEYTFKSVVIKMGVKAYANRKERKDFLDIALRLEQKRTDRREKEEREQAEIMERRKQQRILITLPRNFLANQQAISESPVPPVQVHLSSTPEGPERT